VRLFRAYSVYPAYVDYFYGVHPELERGSFQAQKQAHDAEAVAWGSAYGRALAPLGYESLEIPLNMEPMQRAWAAENGLPDPAHADPHGVLEAQIREFKPEIIWYDHHDPGLLRRLRAAAGSVRLVLGWMGSPISARNAWDQMDLVLSCAPEAVAYLRALGVPSEHLHHAFDDAVLGRLTPPRREIPLTFIGGIIRRNRYHLNRDRILTRLVAHLPLEIYSPDKAPPPGDYAKAAVSGALYLVTSSLRALGLLEGAIRRSHLVRKAALIATAPRMPVNRRLGRHLKPAVFGLGMYQLERDSAVVLNVHADSSPEYASNMRLYEVAGVGSCLLTDWRKNMGELFEPDREVVTYASPEECVEKARWLLDHPRERAEIARAGQARILKEHTFAARAPQLDGIVRRALGTKAA
jgi:spore maturation protein CgeB